MNPLFNRPTDGGLELDEPDAEAERLCRVFLTCNTHDLAHDTNRRGLVRHLKTEQEAGTDAHGDPRAQKKTADTQIVRRQFHQRIAMLILQPDGEDRLSPFKQALMALARDLIEEW